MKSKKHLIIGRIIPDYGCFPLAVTFLFNMSVYCGSRMITRNLYHHNFESGFDRLIPFVPWTVFFYLASYFFWITNYILCVRIDRDHAYRFLSADLVAKCICFLFFLLLPTANTRPEIIGNDFLQNSLSGT